MNETIDRSYDDLASTLKRDGLLAGLGFLNHRVIHRFSAIFRLEDMVLHNVSLVDKGKEVFDASAFKEIPFDHSFCQFVLRDGYFRTHQTSALAMLEGHPYQGVLESYVGVPLMLTPDRMYGTLCHFDFSRQKLDDDEFELLQRAARLLPMYL